MQIIFLDIDGVLVPQNFSTPEEIPTFDQKTIHRLNTLTSHFNALLVISSTWRLMHNLEKLQNILQQKGVKAPIIDQTPFIPYQPRHKEILTWLSNNLHNPFVELQSFTIIDDITDMGPLSRYSIKVNPKTGLTLENIGQATKILNIDL